MTISSNMNTLCNIFRTKRVFGNRSSHIAALLWNDALVVKILKIFILGDYKKA
jgi:hypothetical protein